MGGICSSAILVGIIIAESLISVVPFSSSYGYV